VGTNIWPSLLAAVTLPAVGAPAAVASYRHARDVITDRITPRISVQFCHA
jgi:hypothetical protein